MNDDDDIGRALVNDEDLRLSDEAAQILAAMPAAVAPTQLAAGFPHIVNRIARLWKIPRQMDPYLDSLVIDQRGGRQGFPAPIAWEVVRLKDYYQTVVYPLPNSHAKWNSVI
jgi:hypothetical protein